MVENNFLFAGRVVYLVLRLHMLVHIRPVDEFLSTVLVATYVRSLTSMDPPMSVEPAAVLKFSSAELAGVIKRVRVD